MISVVLRNKFAFWQILKRDFYSEYVNSYLGITWSIIQPTIFICIMWFVFSYGFRSGRDIGETPFIAYLFVGQAGWLFFSGILSSGTNCIRKYKFLIKQADFDIRLLLFIQIASNIIYHSIFFILVLTVLLLNSLYPSIHWLFFLYYTFACSFLMLGLIHISASLAVFIPDISNMVRIFIRVGFWLTPIFWKIEMIPEKFRWVLMLNPAFYIVDGYRQTLLWDKFPWQQHTWIHVYFWGFSILTFLLGSVFFKKRHPYFAEVL